MVNHKMTDAGCGHAFPWPALAMSSSEAWATTQWFAKPPIHVTNRITLPWLLRRWPARFQHQQDREANPERWEGQKGLWHMFQHVSTAVLALRHQHRTSELPVSASMSSPKNLVQSFAILISPWWFWFATDIVPTCTQDIRDWLINCKQWWNQYW